MPNCTGALLCGSATYVYLDKKKSICIFFWQSRDAAARGQSYRPANINIFFSFFSLICLPDTCLAIVWVVCQPKLSLPTTFLVFFFWVVLKMRHSRKNNQRVVFCWTNKRTIIWKTKYLKKADCKNKKKK